MLQHKNFIDIKAFQTKMADCFRVGDIVHISEKLDGSNASFQYNAESGELDCFSRSTTLDESNTLKGFYGYVKKLDALEFQDYADCRFFGEWNLAHLVKHQPEQVKRFHCFDIYDTQTKQWMPQVVVDLMCKALDIQRVPVFYHGPFISWEHVQSFIGQTSFGLTFGEGVVLKNQTRLNDPNDRLPFVVKLVATEYQEKAATKIREPLSMDEIAKREYLNALVASVVTENRVEKILYKSIVAGAYPENWGASSMGLFAKEMPKLVYYDCLKEEPETVALVEEFGKLCASRTMSVLKEMLAKRV